MHIVDQHRALPDLTFADLENYLQTELGFVFKNIVVVVYCPSFNDGESCETTIEAVLPVFHDRDCNKERAEELLQYARPVEFMDWIRTNPYASQLFTQRCLGTDNYYWISLSGNLLHSGDTYLYYDVTFGCTVANFELIAED